MRFGLNEDIIIKLNQLFASDCKIEKVIIYGSRAIGSYSEGSDIDLTIVSDSFTFSDLLQLKSSIDDLYIAYKVDLSIYNQIDNPELLDHIKQYGKVFYKKSN